MLTPLNILIADDDDGDRKQIRRALKQAGFTCRVVEAVDTRNAFLACEDQTIDCAFIDYLMPGQNGLEGIAELHARWPFLAIVMITGQGDELVASEAIKSGASDYIPKRAISELSIRRIVDNALGKTRLQRKVAEQQRDLVNFAKILVHDLRSPIRSIEFFAQMVKAGIADGQLAQIAEDCGEIVASTARMNGLIDTLFQYTQAQNEVAFEIVALGAALDDALKNLHETIKHRQASVTHSTLPTVWGHRVLLTQLFQNLIANGIKYCEASTPAIHVEAAEADAHWKISVKDNGIGIPAKDRERVFQPFQRLHGDEVYAGTGLGLATCLRIIQQHRGQIWCESAESGGTRFLFTIPSAEEIRLPDG